MQEAKTRRLAEMRRASTRDLWHKCGVRGCPSYATRGAEYCTKHSAGLVGAPWPTRAGPLVCLFVCVFVCLFVRVLRKRSGRSAPVGPSSKPAAAHSPARVQRGRRPRWRGRSQRRASASRPRPLRLARCSALPPSIGAPFRPPLPTHTHTCLRRSLFRSTRSAHAKASACARGAHERAGASAPRSDHEAEVRLVPCAANALSAVSWNPAIRGSLRSK